MRRKFQSRAAGRPVGPSRPNAMASSDGVFRDLIVSCEKAAHLLVRADMLIEGSQGDYIERAQEHAEAARTVYLTRSRVGDVLRGRIDLFSTDALYVYATIDETRTAGWGRHQRQALRRTDSP